MPTTILSRCQRFDLKRISTALVRDHLLMIAGKEKMTITPAAAEAIARGAEGGMRARSRCSISSWRFAGTTSMSLRCCGCSGLRRRRRSRSSPNIFLRTMPRERCGWCTSKAKKDAISCGARRPHSHLRNVLVAKADATALQQELSAEAAAVVAEQATRIDMARLLELIEQFAGTEGRMKWAPNKKMHLEVAVIRAIQTLSQATLSEVLDALTAMRNGVAAPVAPAPRIAAKAVTPSVAGASTRGHPERSEPKASAVEGPGTCGNDGRLGES